jgi:hypothetical protein
MSGAVHLARSARQCRPRGNAKDRANDDANGEVMRRGANRDTNGEAKRRQSFRAVHDDLSRRGERIPVNPNVG